MEISSKHYGTNAYKSRRISKWKRYGVVCEDFDMLYQEYIKKTKCEHCGKDFKSTRDRCLDHDHSTGLFRAVVCQACNVCDTYIKYPNGYDKKGHQKQYREKNKEHYKQWREENKEKISERKKQKVICECGSVFRIDEFLRHNRSFKHMNPFCDYPKTNIFT
jgi:hypothetical protein